MSEKLTKAKIAKIKQNIPNIESMDTDKQRQMICAMYGHSMIQSLCFGYYSCGRCGQQLGDSLASVYPQAENVVVIGHNCDKCRENFKKLKWHDKVLVENPFTSELKE